MKRLHLFNTLGTSPLVRFMWQAQLNIYPWLIKTSPLDSNWLSLHFEKAMILTFQLPPLELLLKLKIKVSVALFMLDAPVWKKPSNKPRLSFLYFSDSWNISIIFLTTTLINQNRHSLTHTHHVCFNASKNCSRFPLAEMFLSICS